MSVGSVDLGILVAYLVGVVLLGLWIGRKAGSVSDFVVGGRNRPWWLILFSIVATETSTVTFLSIPGFAYSRDMTWLQIPLGFLLGLLALLRLLLARKFGCLLRRNSLFTLFLSLGLGAILVVIVSVVASLTLLPAMLSLLGDRVNSLRIPFLLPAQPKADGQGSSGFWDRVSRAVMRAPVVSIVLAAGLMVAAAVPILVVILHDIDDGSLKVD